MIRRLSGAVVIALLAVCAVCRAADQEVAPLLPNVWAPCGEIAWEPADGDVWRSLGHSATVLTISADGEPGKPAHLTMTVFRVQTFNAETRAPEQVETLDEKTIAIADLDAAEGRRLSHVFHIPGETFRYCLMAKLQGAAEETDDAPATPLAARMAVIEMVLDPTVPTTSKWIEPTNDPGTTWAAREPLLAPWADGSALEGALTHDEAGRMQFGAARKPKARTPDSAGPRIETELESET